MTYRVLVCDFQTNQVKTELPWYQFGFSEALNGAGEISLVVPLRRSKITFANIYPWTTSIYIERNGEILIGGIITACSPSTEEGTLTIQAATLYYYTAARILKNTKVYNYGDDQTSVVCKDLIDQLISDFDIGWQVDCPASGVTREWDLIPFYAYERREFATLFDRLMKFDNGFDISIDSEWSGGQIIDTFKTHYPKKGIRKVTKWVKYLKGEPGSNIDIVNATFDGNEQANSLHVLGKGEAYAMLLTTATNTNKIGVGKYPLIERVYTDKSLDTDQELVDRGSELLRLSAEPRITAQLMLDPDHQDTQIGTFAVGDEINIEASDGWVVMDGVWRITDYAMEVTDGEQENLNVSVTKQVI